MPWHAMRSRFGLALLALGWALLIDAKPVHAGEWTAGIDAVRELARAGLDALGRLPPSFFFATMAVVCVLPIPVSAFYVAGAAIYGPLTTLAWVAVALAANIWLSQTLATRGLRPFATHLLESRGMKVPQPRVRRDEILLILAVRLTPGVPFFAQNLALGLANVDRARSLAISLPIQMAFACGFVMLGRSALEGSLGTAIGALGLIVSLSLVARFVHRKLAAQTRAHAART